MLGESRSGIASRAWSFHGGPCQLDGVSKDLDQLVLGDGVA